MSDSNNCVASTFAKHVRNILYMSIEKFAFNIIER